MQKNKDTSSTASHATRTQDFTKANQICGSRTAKLEDVLIRSAGNYNKLNCNTEQYYKAERRYDTGD